MPEIEIRSANPADLPHLIAIEHGYSTDTVWQMDVDSENDHIEAVFHKVRLPRSVRVEYPRDPKRLAEDWETRSIVLVALHENKPVGYLSITEGIAPATNWVTDLAVTPRMRKQGIGTALVLAAEEWARQANGNRIVLEMQPKNYAAVRLAKKLGFRFCGFNDRYYPNNDIALFYARQV